MKIVLPKTLAEPLTIPWFNSDKSTSDLVEHIMYAIYEAFAASQVTRKEHMIIHDLLDMLVRVAERNGALEAIPHYAHIWSTDEKRKHIGYRYFIHFKVPNDTRVHLESIRFYFGETPWCESP